MFLVLLGLVVSAAVVDAILRRPRPAERVAEGFLRWLLVGYCGIPMAVVSVGILVAPGWISQMLPLGGPSTLAAFFGWAYLGMSVTAIMALRWTGPFLPGPAVAWAIYLLGATVVHFHAGGHDTAGPGALYLIATHGLVGVMLIGALALGGSRVAPRANADAGPRSRHG